MQVDGTRPLHSVVDVEHHFGGHAADSRRDRRDGYRRQVADSAVARQDQNRSRFVRGRESAKADIPPAQSCGHAAASSHTRYSLGRWGLAIYPRRSCSSSSSSCKRLRCSCRARRISADRFTLCRLAAASAAFKSLDSRTTCMVSTVYLCTQYSPHHRLSDSSSRSVWARCSLVISVVILIRCAFRRANRA